MIVVLLLFCFSTCFGQTQNGALSPSDTGPQETEISNILTENIGNFSIELLYHTSTLKTPWQNMVISPLSIWTALAVIAESAVGETRMQVKHALRIPIVKNTTRENFTAIARWLEFNKTDIIELVQFNGIFIDKQTLPLNDIIEDAKTYYGMNIVSVSLEDTERTANLLNRVVSNFTHGFFPSIIQSSDFRSASIVLSSALHLKGKWKIPFNATLTRKQAFYDSERNKIGEVNMMYNRGTYPYAESHLLQARIIELPIGTENRLSMVVMIPNYGVSLKDLFYNFYKVSIKALFNEFKPMVDDFSRTEIEFHMPRFKIISDFDMTEVLKQKFNIRNMFEPTSILPYLARTPVYASKLLHKAEIEITEDGIPPEDDIDEEFSNIVGVAWFEANRPFAYVIVEKTTNTIVLGGVYTQPSLY